MTDAPDGRPTSLAAENARYRFARRLNIVPGLGLVWLYPAPRSLPYLVAGIAVWVFVGVELFGSTSTYLPSALGFLLSVWLITRARTARVHLRAAGPVTAADGFERAIAEARANTQPCPRCSRAVRGPSGWCDACWSALQGPPLAEDHVVRRFIAAGAHHRFREMKSLVGPTIEQRAFDGAPTTLRARRYVLHVRAAHIAFPVQRDNTDVIQQDPVDEHLVWVRSTSTLASPQTGIEAVLRTTFRYRVGAAGLTGIAFALPMSGSSVHRLAPGTEFPTGDAGRQPAAPIV